MKNKIVFFGSGKYTIPIIEILIKHGLRFVITTETESSFINYLKKQNIPFISSDLKNKKDINSLIDLKMDIGILASYGSILPELIIENCKLGIFNIHPSLLPKYKGPSPIQAAILNGDKQTGVTIIKLDKEIDHGPIAGQKIVKLNGDETMDDLTNKLFSIGAEMTGTLLTKIENGETLNVAGQNHSKTVFTSKITRLSGFIDITKPPSPAIIERMIRAYYPWPGIWITYPLHEKEKRIKLLPGQKFQVEGKNIMSEKEFVNGYGKQACEILGKLGFASQKA